MTWRDIDTASRRALVFTPMETRRRVLIDAAVQAEALGYEAIIVPEGWGLDASIVLAEIALRTERITLVAGILSIWNRTPATIAMTAATLNDLSGGRFVLGLGASTATLAEGLHDVAFTAPAATLRATVSEVRALLSGERASTSSGVRGLRLGQTPQPELPIWVAGLGPRSVATAAELGDGWLPAMLPLDGFEQVLHAASPRATDHCEVITCVMAGVDHGGTTGKRRAEQLVGWYLTGMGPFYGDVAAAHGFGAAVDAVRAANPRPAPGSIVWPNEADALLAQLAVFGTPGAVRSACEDWDQRSDVVAVGVGPVEVDAISALIEAAAPVHASSSHASASTAATCTSTGEPTAEAEPVAASSSRSRR